MVGPALRLELERALAVADRANNAVLQERDGRWTVQGDPTEGALVVAARKVGLDADALEARFQRVGEVPFSSERKLMSTVHTDAEQAERLLVFTKGAPDVLLARCSRELVGEEHAPAERGAARGDPGCERRAGRAVRLRTLGIAYRALPADAARARRGRRARRARPGVRRPRRHDRPAPRRGARRGRAGEGARESAR